MAPKTKALTRTAKSCGPDAPTLASSLAGSIPQATVANKPGHRGEHEVSRKTIARGMPGCSGVLVVTTLVCFIYYFAREAAGASSARHSLRPRFEGAGPKRKPRAKTRGEIANSWHAALPSSTRSCAWRGGVGGGGLSAGTAASVYAHHPPPPTPPRRFAGEGEQLNLRRDDAGNDSSQLFPAFVAFSIRRASTDQ